MFQTFLLTFHLYVTLVMVVNVNIAETFSQPKDLNSIRTLPLFVPDHKKINYNHNLQPFYNDSKGPRIDEDCSGQIEYLKLTTDDGEHGFVHGTVVKLDKIQYEQYTDVVELRFLLLEALRKQKTIKLFTERCHIGNHWFGSFQILSD